MQPGATLRPVLVVDDNPDDLFFFKRSLAKASVANPLLIANDGEEAIGSLTTMIESPGAPPDRLPLIVFLDLKLPRVSGFAVLEWIRSRRELASVPVAVLSSSAEPRDVTRAYRLGAQTYLVKHPLLTDLVAMIATVEKCSSLEELSALPLPGIKAP